MTTASEALTARLAPARRRDVDVDVLVVGAGITGIYQLHRAREAGFSAQLVEAGSGVGGTWYWNRYPGARFDSESYTYGYLFSQELFDEWEWQEHFAAQPETERYLNHVVDRFDLRRHMRFDAPVTAGRRATSRRATWDGRRSADGADRCGPGSWSPPPACCRCRTSPDVPGRDDFRGEQHHTGRWPATPVDFAGKRVAVVGTSSSGVQVVPDDPRRGRSRSPSTSAPPTGARRSTTRRSPPTSRRSCGPTSRTCARCSTRRSAASPTRSTMRTAFDDGEAERQAFYEKMWASPGFMKLTSNYADLLFNEAANDEWCEFIAGKIRCDRARTRRPPSG